MIKISDTCINLIKGFEAFRAKAYHGQADPPKVFTIGYGTIKYPPNYLSGKMVALTDPIITEKQATDFLLFEVTKKADYIDPFLRDDLSDNQFASLLSFAYNVGEYGLKGSTLLRRVNSNPLETSIRDAFMMWVKDEHGHTVEGLVNRRKQEADLYFTT